MGHGWLRLVVLAVLALGGGVAQAEYGEECRALSAQLARDPASLKVGDLDVLKTCLSDLQRVIVVGGTPPTGVAELCPPAVTDPPKCPVCPRSEACPRAPAAGREPAPAAPPPREKPSTRERDDDRRLKPFLPVF